MAPPSVLVPCPARAQGAGPAVGSGAAVAQRARGGLGGSSGGDGHGPDLGLASITSCRKSFHLPRCERTAALPAGCPALPRQAPASYANRFSRFLN